VASWAEFAARRPDLADAGKTLLYQYGVGLGFLATVRRDGGPRVHPMCPLLAGEGLYAFIVPGPKRADLRRDGRYALHSFPCEDNEDAFYITGNATLVEDPGIRAALAAQFVRERGDQGAPAPAAEDELFAFSLARCLLTRTSGHGDPHPQHTVWQDRRQ
jgi:hypothetical protein